MLTAAQTIFSIKKCKKYINYKEAQYIEDYNNVLRMQKIIDGI